MARERQKGARAKHKCPPLPGGFVKFLNPYWTGQHLEESRTMWDAHVRRVGRLRPIPRRTF